MKEKFTADTFLLISEKWNSILKSGTDIEEIRRELLHHINHRHFITYSEKDEDMHDLDLVTIRDCSRVLRSILHPRSEKLAGFSVLSELINTVNGNPDPQLSEAFWGDICHLVCGIEGKFRLHENTRFSFANTGALKGRDAAQIRSDELDTIHDYLDSKMSKYLCGLDSEIIKKREKNRKKILDFTGADESKWNDWHWQLQHIAKNNETLNGYTVLSDEETENIKKANALGIPFGVTPYYSSLFIGPDYGEDRSVRAQVLFPESYIDAFEGSGREDYINDFMLEHDTSPVDLITRRYPGIVILKPYNSCPQICVYCQRNWEIKGPLEAGAMAEEKQLNEAIKWIEEHKAITEVLITGGDPLVMSDSRIKDIIDKISRIDHVERIRIGSRTPVTLPMRFTDELCDILASFRIPGKKELALVTHIQHPYEVTPDFVKAVEKIKTRGISVYNQMVFTFYNSRRFEAVRLRTLIRLCGVDPYYSFYPKGKLETVDYRIPISRILQEQKEESRLMPGLSRTDEPVYNVPGLGKNHLNSGQHRDMISINKDGSRIYEFHPWEKKIADQKTYVGTDVPILDYLKRLESIGESASDYETIWYYF
ncbi:MAG TPA: KamA family radical SAM protein [Spirochaetota bacterium]|nr:KamA family radical SAM protein [Spirochaetota bacterium]HPJ34681.1 KamA family radical SAM protein [Spirochaetota bacterium]